MVLQIEKQMKRLLNAPPALGLPDKSTLLRELPWLRALPDAVFAKIEGGVEEVLFEDGDAIVQQARPAIHCRTPTYLHELPTLHHAINAPIFSVTIFP